MIRRPPISTRTDTLFPYTTLFRSGALHLLVLAQVHFQRPVGDQLDVVEAGHAGAVVAHGAVARGDVHDRRVLAEGLPHDRDESIGPNKPFLDIARGPAAQGIAVLRSDKRPKARHQAYAHGTGPPARQKTSATVSAQARQKGESQRRWQN